jgi:glutamine amidotransferase
VQRIAVIDYGSGNLASAARAAARAAELAGIAVEVGITADPSEIARADRLILPGQGAFADCAAGLAAIPGLRAAIAARVAAGAPFLGICVGMQLMAERGLEHAVTPGFGWVRGDIAPMAAPGLRLPHMGWNALHLHVPDHPLLAGIAEGDHVYFVHSYALTGYDPADLLASAEYGGIVPALIARGNCAGTQFHVEKSQGVGLRLLQNFLCWKP